MTGALAAILDPAVTAEDGRHTLKIVENTDRVNIGLTYGLT